MEKVQSGSITEEFSFSRALYLMQNSGEKVRCVDYHKCEYLCIEKDSYGDDKIFHYGTDNKYDLYKHYKDQQAFSIFADDILTSWTIYDERLHG